MAEGIKVGSLQVRVSGGGGVLEPVKVELTRESLCVFKHDFIQEDTFASFDFINERTVTLERDEAGFGVYIQGGVEDKSPIKLYRVTENSPAFHSGQVQEGDIVLKVNGKSLWGKRHQDVVELIRNSGERVTLELVSLKDKHEASGTFQDEFQKAEEPCWMDHIKVPLSFASITRYHKGTATLRPDAFQVLSKDGQSKVTLHCSNEQLSEWITAIDTRIRELSGAELESFNSAQLDDNDRIQLLGWVYEHVPSNIHTRIWQRKLMVIRKLQLQIFGSFPENMEEWLRPEKAYRLVEMTVQVLKAHELVEQRANSILLTSGTGENHTISFETTDKLAEWTQAIYNARIDAALHLKKQQFLARWKGQEVYFSVDAEQGSFIVYSRTNYVLQWSKPFSWLKHSCDDGHSSLHLEFHIPDSQVTEKQDIEMEDLQIAVCVIESFLMATVSFLDSNFVPQEDCVVH